MSQLLQQPLPNGLILIFTDRSNRYYGNFHRVCIDVCCAVPLTVELFAHCPDAAVRLAEALRLLGPQLDYRRTLERMGVAGGEVEAVRLELIRQFLQTAGAYLGRPDFPRRLLERQLAQRRGRG